MEETAIQLLESVQTADTQQAHPVILVMHASIGSGHRTAADAIRKQIELMRDSDDPCVPPDAEVVFIDVLDWSRVRINGNKYASRFTGSTRPIYDLTWRYWLTGHVNWGGGTIWIDLMFPQFTKYIAAVKPIAVIATHITAANVAIGARMKTGIYFPVVCVPTDYETEGMWPHLSGDMFCVGTASMAETLRPRRVPETRITVTGIPTNPQFCTTYDKQEALSEFNLPTDKKIALCLAGAHMAQPYVLFRSQIDKLLPALHRFDDLHLVLVCGNDEEYRTRCEKIVAEYGLTNVTVTGYVSNIAKLMSACDLCICKSGGLTVTECMNAQVPMILLGRAYGQEKVNMRMLTETASAMHVTTYRELIGALSHIQAHPEAMRAMLMNAEPMRHVDAAEKIVRATMSLAGIVPPSGDETRKKHFIKFYWGGKPAHVR